MQRKDINRTEYAYIAAELIDSEVLPGAKRNVLVVSGVHEEHGRVILVTAGEPRIDSELVGKAPGRTTEAWSPN